MGSTQRPGLRNVRCEQIQVVGGTSPTNSAIILPSGVCAAILGVAVALQADLSGVPRWLRFQMTRAASPLLSISADASGTYAHVLPEVWFKAGQGPLLIPTLHQEGSPLITAEGDGSNPRWRVAHTLPSAVNALVTVTFWPFLATDVVTC